MRRSALMGIAAVAFVASNAFAQATSFAGTWNQVVDPAQQQAAGGRGGRGGGGGIGFAGMTFTVAQDANSVTITRTQGENTVTTKFMTDGTDSKNTIQGRGGPQEIVSKAKWEGNALVISTTRTMGENTFTTTQKVWIENGDLVVENTQPNPQGGDAIVRKVTYKKG